VAVWGEVMLGTITAMYRSLYASFT
jgi:hypothetical protein